MGDLNAVVGQEESVDKNKTKIGIWNVRTGEANEKVIIYFIILFIAKHTAFAI